MLTYREAAWVGGDRLYLATLGLTGDEIVGLGWRLFLLLPQLLLSTTKRFRPDHWESRASMRVGIAKRAQARAVLFLSGATGELCTAHSKTLRQNRLSLQ